MATVLGTGWLRTFASLSVRDYRWLWLGTAASFMSMQMQEVARGWLVYDMTGSPLALGLVVGAWGLPMVALSTVGGVVVDRVSKRRVILLTQAGQVLITLAQAVLIVLGLIQVWHLVLAGFLQGALFPFNIPARQALISDVVGEDRLMNAIVLNGAAINATRLVGPALAGVLVAVLGVGVVFFLMAFCYALAAWTTALVSVPGNPMPGRQGSIRSELFSGLRYMRGDAAISALMLLAFAPIFFGMPYRSLMPAYASGVLHTGPEGLGLLMTVTGAGALCGSLVIAGLGDFHRKGLLLLWACLMWGVFLALFALSRSFLLSSLSLLFVGAGSTAFMSINSTLIQTHAPPEMRGRVLSVWYMTFGLMPLAILPAGAIAEAVGVATTLATGGVALALFILGMMVLRPQLRRM